MLDKKDFDKAEKKLAQKIWEDTGYLRYDEAEAQAKKIRKGWEK